MKIEYIEFKNFASYGNNSQRIDLNGDVAELILTLGKNGHGKTTIANAIVFALYGKVESVKLGDLPNRINKELLVNIRLLCGTTIVEIERGLAPGKFEVKLNGVEFDKAGKKSVQEYLEEEVFGIPYHVFKNIIILSVNDFKSFLTMSNYDKKRIIDRMFGFSILNDMQNALKDERKLIKSDIESFDAELNQINENVMSVNSKLNELTSESKEKNKERVEELKKTLISLSEQKTKLSEANITITGKITESSTQLTSEQTELNRLSFKLKSLKKQIGLYENNICPTCESELSTEFHKDRKCEIQKESDSIPNKVDEVQLKLDDINSQIVSLRTKKSAVGIKVSSINSQISGFKKEILSLRTTDTSKNFKHLNQIIADFEKSSEQKSNERDMLNADFSFLDVVDDILGEDGIKNMAVKSILPVLNTNIAAMLTTMHLHFQVRFDEKFNCIVHHLGEEINPMTLSTGERKKADFVVIIALIKLLKLRFPQLNLLFLDELLSSIDADGIHNIVKILGNVIRENHINTFVINHTELPRELFDKKIQIYKENGFSKLDIEVIE
jgi:exonuclease SbcC